MPRPHNSQSAWTILNTRTTVCRAAAWQACKALLCGSAIMPAQRIGASGPWTSAKVPKPITCWCWTLTAPTSRTSSSLSSAIAVNTNDKSSAVPTLAHKRHDAGRSPPSQQAAAAQRSEISQESFTADRFLQTLQAFIQVAPDLLLFTRHVKAVSVYSKQTKEGPCKLLHESTTSVSYMSSLPGWQLQQVTVHMQSAGNPMTTKVWVKTACSAKETSQGSIAVLLQDSSVSIVNTLPEVVSKTWSVQLQSLTTNLPVHINGAFCMSSDRHSLWTEEGDQGEVLTLLC